MDKKHPIYSEKTQCQDCYKCVRHCPVKAIYIRDHSARVLPEKCILCGKCVTVCPSRAKKIRNDIYRAKHLLTHKKMTIASLAPSFVSHYRTIDKKKIIQGLKQLGFAKVSETAVGAEAISRETAKYITNSDKKIHLSSACPVAVNYIEKYFPDLTDSITPLHSPLCAHAKILKDRYGKDTSIVFIGPCIAKKKESDQFGELVDIALSFQELDDWFLEEGITLSELDNASNARFEPYESNSGCLYPVEGGMCDTIKLEEGVDSRLISLSGLEGFDKALEGIRGADVDYKLFVELLACHGGCINGPVADSSGTIVGQNKIYNYFETKTLTKIENKMLDVSRSFSPEVPASIDYSNTEITSALERVGKFCIEDELNCGGCGYFTCRDFSKALLEGKAEDNMCVSYMRRLAQKKANALLKTIPFGVLIVDSELKILDSNSEFLSLLDEDAALVNQVVPALKGARVDNFIPIGKHFSEILKNGVGNSTCILNWKGKILKITTFEVEPKRYVGALLEDVTKLETRRQEVVSKAKQVIFNSIDTVQDIAMRLGRNTADSEVILNSIIECYGDPEQSGNLFTGEAKNDF